MQTNLTARSVIIVLVILACVYGIIGFPTSMAAIQKNFSNNIHLGLDLKGGSQLVLEVQVQDAVKADALQASERLKEDLKKENISWGSMDVNDVATVADANQVALTIKGVPADAVQRLPQHRLRALSHLQPHVGEFHRLPDEAQAHRVDHARSRNRAALHRYHRQPHRPAWARRKIRSAIRPRRRRLPDPGAVARRGRSRAHAEN